MATRRILIVDDSRTAQARLRKMLAGYDAEIDTVNSAEEALGYLSYKQPSIIFLDHHMEGMDGLAALKIIKSNPATALIPVVMYTSEQADVYVGQARALGALDIISKGVVKPSNLTTLMSSLNFEERVESGTLDDKLSSKLPLQGPISRPSAEAKAYVDKTELEQVQAQVSRLFEIHIAKVRQEIEDNTKFLTRRLSRDIQDKTVSTAGEKTTEDKTETDYSDVVAPVEAPAHTSSGPSTVLVIILFLSVCFTSFYLYVSNQQLSTLADRYDALVEQFDTRQGSMLDVIHSLTEQTKERATHSNERILFDALGWAVNVDSNTPFGQQALGDERIYMLGELLSLLTASSFKGTIFLDVHAGNYCVVETADGELALPEPESKLDDCTFLSDRNEEITLQTDISIGFLNYINSTPILTDGDILLEMESLGFSSPKYSYPPTSNAVTAGEWNEAAQRNSRLAFSFIPD